MCVRIYSSLSLARTDTYNGRRGASDPPTHGAVYDTAYSARPRMGRFRTRCGRLVRVIGPQWQHESSHQARTARRGRGLVSCRTVRDGVRDTVRGGAVHPRAPPACVARSERLDRTRGSVLHTEMPSVHTSCPYFQNRRFGARCRSCAHTSHTDMNVPPHLSIS